MTDIHTTEYQTLLVSNFHTLINTDFCEEVNAIGWKRNLAGDFFEIVNKIVLCGNITTIEPEQLISLQLSEQGQLAREILLNDWKLLQAHGALPTLNVIRYYDRDNTFPFLPTDVYSFHVDRSPVATDTFLCTYFGEPSEILPNSQCEKKVLIPEIRSELKKIYDGDENDFETFLSEHFFDLHYQAKANATPISLGIGNLWRLAVEHPDSRVPPCVHRAPKEKAGELRLLMIC